MTEQELIVMALRYFANARLVDLMVDEGMTTVEGNQVRADAEALADRLAAVSA